jgi:hypothetical protein
MEVSVSHEAHRMAAARPGTGQPAVAGLGAAVLLWAVLATGCRNAAAEAAAHSTTGPPPAGNVPERRTAADAAAVRPVDGGRPPACVSFADACRAVVRRGAWATGRANNGPNIRVRVVGLAPAAPGSLKLPCATGEARALWILRVNVENRGDTAAEVLLTSWTVVTSDHHGADGARLLCDGRWSWIEPIGLTITPGRRRTLVVPFVLHAGAAPAYVGLCDDDFPLCFALGPTQCVLRGRR